MSAFLTHLAARSVANLFATVVPRADPYLSLASSPVSEMTTGFQGPDSQPGESAVESSPSSISSNEGIASGSFPDPTHAIGSSDFGNPETNLSSTDQKIQHENPAKSKSVAKGGNPKVTPAGSIEPGAGYLTRLASSSMAPTRQEPIPRADPNAIPRGEEVSSSHSAAETKAPESALHQPVSSLTGPPELSSRNALSMSQVENVKSEARIQSSAPRIEPAKWSPGVNQSAPKAEEPVGPTPVTPGRQPVRSPGIEHPQESRGSPVPAATRPEPAEGMPSGMTKGSASNQDDPAAGRRNSTREPASGSNPPRTFVAPASAGQTGHSSLTPHAKNQPAVRVHIGTIEVKAAGKVSPPKAGRTKPAAPSRSRGQGFEAYGHLRG